MKPPRAILLVAVLGAIAHLIRGNEVVKFARTLEGSGSHRELKTDISLQLDNKFQGDSCRLSLVENLPSSVFADTFQLQRLTRMGRYEAAHVSGDLDLERPAFFSGPVTPLGIDSYHLVNLSSPSVAVSCKKNAEELQLELAASEEVQWPIPAGNPNDASTVNRFTALAAAAGTLVLCSISVMKKRCPWC
ncbi:uncharacterized protein LOC112340442 [Selaginella moellendorffii]|uniref:uncharacterized protein LOC112340442 n=1 Tax=Selaginella moellendorffii TaxID=88036 RepID=UPI000D1C555E|nr:uncharacterized protein LOC112340442 [Selaginella moellendorffii]|eukprot:XP_024532134.1 uncharacterized protein LOC112340442 [Selaginella moellendorffii]